MEESKSTKFIRVLALLLGLFMFGMAAFAYFIEGESDLWVGLILGPIFFLFGLLGRVDLCGMKNKQHEDKV